MPYTQSGHPMAVKMDQLGADDLLLEKFTGSERISGLFEFHLEMLAEFGTTIDFAKVLGQPATVRLDCAGVTPPTARTFNGIVTRFVKGMDIVGPGGLATFTRYRATLSPALWKLTRRINSRLCLDRSIPEVLTDLFTGMEINNRLSTDADAYPKRPLVVQYGETDFDFASRLMEEVGIFYYFNHSRDDNGKGKHTLVLGDRKDNYDPVDPDAPLYMVGQVNEETPANRLLTWIKEQDWAPGKSLLWDYQFQLAGNSIRAEKPILEKIQVGTVEHKLKVAGNDTELQQYVYPGGYAKLVDGVGMDGQAQAAKLQDVFKYKETFARIEMERVAAASLRITGTSTCAQLTAGHKMAAVSMNLTWDGLGNYAVTEVTHHSSLEGVYQNTGGAQPGYHNSFACLPLDLPFRPQATTPRPKISGYLPAVVVGTTGNDVFTEKNARVQVQFYWDRQGRSDLTNKKGDSIGTLAYWNGASGRATNSVWLRVGQAWADRTFGTIYTPRLGQEVLVGFQDGDPDQPAVLGASYNSVNNPAFPLDDPAFPLTSGVKSHIDGKDLTQFHGIALDDRADVQMFMMQTAKDMIINIPNDLLINVGKNCYINANGAYKQTQGVPITLPGFSQGSFPTINVPKAADKPIEAYNWTIGNITASIGKKLAIVFGEDTKAVVGLSASITVGNKLDLLCDPLSLLGMIPGAGALHGMHGWSNIAGRNEFILAGKNETVLLPKFSTVLSAKYDIGCGSQVPGVGGVAPAKATVGSTANAIKIFCGIVNLLVFAELLWYGGSPTRASENFGIFVTVVVGVVLILLWAVAGWGGALAEGIDNGIIALKNKIVGLVARITWEIAFVAIGIAFLLLLVAIAIAAAVTGGFTK